MGVLMRELAALYEAFRAGRAVAAAGAAGAVRGLRGVAARVAAGRGAGGAARRTGASSWPARRALLELPTDRPRPAVQTYRGAPVPVQLAAELLRAGCRRWAGSEGATLFMTLLAAFQALLAPLRGQDDVVRRHARSPAATRRGDGGADRLLRQHAGAARRPVGRPDASASCWRGCGRRRWGRTRTRTCRSSSWWRSCSRSAT